MHCHCLTVVTTRITFVVVMIEVSQSVMNFQQRHSSHITVRVSPSCFFAFRFDYLFSFFRFTNQEQCILQKTAFSQVKSRLALGSPGWFFVRHHAENGPIHRKMLVDCPLLITSKVKLFFRPDNSRKKE